MKKALVICLLAGLIVSVPAEAKTYRNGDMSVKTTKKTTSVYWHGKKVKSFKNRLQVRYISPEALTYKKLIERKGKILYVEVCSGKVLNNRGDGRLDVSGQYNYIHYRGFKKGTRVKTYLVYNPYTDYEDDIIFRADKRIGGKK